RRRGAGGAETGEQATSGQDGARPWKGAPRPADPSYPVIADPTDHVDPVDQDAPSVPRQPVAHWMVQRVAGSTANAEQLSLGPSPVADTGDVLVAELVQLRGTHHHVPPARRQHREDLAERQPALGHPA